MAPFRSLLVPRGEFDTSVVTEEFWQQWVNPGDVFSILLILGGDIVALALAQLAGAGFTPVSFSFGWVAYSISALVCALGSNKLMPKSTDCDCKVINGKTGYSRENSSWVLGRLVRDFENWTHPETHAQLERNWMELRRRDPSATRPQKIGLVVTVYQPSRVDVPKQPRKDWLYWSGVVVMFVQLGIAAIPLGLFGDWGIILVTAAGIVLSVATGYIPQWRSEKWACRTGSKSSYILTEGNGAQHAFIVLGNQLGLNLEDLATGQNGVGKGKNKSTWIISSILSILWIMLLIAATALKEHTWYLLAIGGLGIVQNIVVAGWSRKPAALGIPLEYVSVHGHPSVMETLFSVEKAYPTLGRSMRDEFFPGKLRPEEEMK